MRERLLAKATDIVSAGIGAGNVKELKPAGDIIWSDSEQAGYIRVTGLPKNDPNRESYQLWIFDETQDPKTPIDGGVFDITTDGEAVIPIDSRLKARNPQAFAITIEKSGGVVVSKQERVAALAKRET
jgi:anti-sigma-K factor RskA